MAKTIVDTARLAEIAACDDHLQAAVVHLRRALSETALAHGIELGRTNGRGPQISDWLNQLKRLEREMDDDSARA